MRYVIGTFKTRAKAEETLEDMFANGEISQGERPDVETVTVQIETPDSIRWAYRYQITAQG